MRRLTGYAAIAIFLVPALLFAQTATAPAPAARPVLGQMRITTLKAATYVYLSTQVQSMADIGRILEDRINTIQTQMQAASVWPTGGLIIVIHSSNPSKIESVEIGFPVADGTFTVAGLQVGQLDSVLAATAVYTGPSDKADLSRLYAQIASSGHHPTETLRQRSLYYEDATSPNNIVLFEIPLQN